MKAGSIKPPAPDLKTKLRFNWNAALAQDPFDKKTVYFGSQFLHKSTNKGVTWEIISPDLTTNDTETTAIRMITGDYQWILPVQKIISTILAIAPSPKQKGVIWVGTDDGNVQLTRDGGKTWTNFRGKIPGCRWVHGYRR